QNDLENPNRRILKGDRFGYDYDINSITGRLWIQNVVNLNRFDFNYGAQFSATSFQRDGKMRNGRAPENSLGKGESHSFINYAFKAGLKTLFTQKGAGLFPSMAKIHFSCSCPDYADMCKHVAAVLYGIGSRFDKDPLLFFKLRGVDTERLIGNAAKPSDRIMDDGDVAAVFGMEI
ncbi:MAG: SWIM zinc finger family protein, partial [Treponema sp.]|nr:SWIM zinc finger family protein [Treponema sp.]